MLQQLHRSLRAAKVLLPSDSSRVYRNPHPRALLTVIQTGLREISGLVPVAHSLLRLVITEQKINKIEGLELPNLRDLLLHSNEILRRCNCGATVVQGFSSLLYGAAWWRCMVVHGGAW